MAVRVTVCRALAVEHDGMRLDGPRLGTRKARVLLAALVAARGTSVSTDHLVEAVWPDEPPQDPVANLATLLSRLRRTVGTELAVPGAASYALARGVELDLDSAAAQLEAASVRLSRAEPTLALSSAAAALDVVGGGALAEELDGAWADDLRREAVALSREARHLVAVAAVATDDPEQAVRVAEEAVRDDPYDERAHRDLMRALVCDGRAAAALAMYTTLAARLADDLGTDPDPATERLHLAILRGEPLDEQPPRVSHPPPDALVGREAELTGLDAAWAAASSEGARLVLVAGVPGIGKTRLLAEAADSARRSGGLVLSTGCRPGERSLFLQPFVEVLRPVLLALPEPALRSLLGAHLPAWARLLPELGELFPVQTEPEVSGALARRRSFDAVGSVLAGLAARRPVLVVVDDLQYGADITADLLAHLASSLGSAPVLLLAASRTEGLAALPQLTTLTRPVVLGPLPPSAVDALTTAAGFPGRSAEIQARSHGHPLSVVASLRALASGTEGVPPDVTAAVAGQLDRLDHDLRALACAGSVLGTHVRPRLLAGLVESSEVRAALACDRLVEAGLMTVVADHYDFANDLVREAVLDTVPRPLAVAFHRRAADLLADRPEEMAGHAHLAGEPGRAARGYLAAGRTARRMAALDDAVALLGQALADAEAADAADLVATVLLERARAREALTDYAAAEADALAARAALTGLHEPRLLLRSVRLLAGDVAVARRLPFDDLVALNRTGIRQAAELGDAVAAAYFRSRIVILESSRLRLGDAHRLAAAGVTEARAAGVPDALVLALDGLKSTLAYAGDAVGLEPVLAELLPLLEQGSRRWLLQWAVLESSLLPASTGDWQQARARVDRALEINRQTGYDAYVGFFLAQRAWLARLAGNLDEARSDGHAAVAQTSPVVHPWWYATAIGGQATTLLDLGRRDEAAALCTTGLAALGDATPPAYRLRCLAPLALATGQGLEEVDALVRVIQAPPGQAWVTGADVYDALATAWVEAGEPGRAATVVQPLLSATATSWRSIHDRLRQKASASRAAARAAPSPGTGR
jgi:DNA-binding SARP family transcriptional activator